MAADTSQNNGYVPYRQLESRKVQYVDLLAYERASFDVVSEVAPVALQEGHRADEAVPERRKLDRSSCK